MPLYLREWRNSLGLSLTQASATIGVHFTALQKWEKGTRKVGSKELRRIARAYGIDEIALYYHPDDRDAAARARRALLILGDMDPQTAEQWLRLAETMLGAGAAPAEVLRLGAPEKIDAPAK